MMLIINYSLNTYCLRNVGDFAMPLHRTTTRGKCIKVCGPKYWDSVPDDIKQIPAEASFKYKLRCSFISKFD